MVILDKVDYKAENTTGNKRGHLIMIRGSFYQEDITIINVIMKYTFFLSAHAIFTKILGHKTNFNKFQKVGIL